GRSGGRGGAGGADGRQRGRSDRRPEEGDQDLHAGKCGDQDLRRRLAGAPASGSSTSMRGPPCWFGVAASRPPCASTVRLAMARPSPVPCGLSEKNGSNRRGSASAGTPGPLSSTTSAPGPVTPPTPTPSWRHPPPPAAAASPVP